MVLPCGSPRLAFLRVGLALHRLTTAKRELLPRVFTLTPLSRGGSFSVALSMAAGPVRLFPLGSTLPWELGLSSPPFFGGATPGSR